MGALRIALRYLQEPSDRDFNILLSDFGDGDLHVSSEMLVIDPVL